ncbi:MAG: hypothetical protein A2365_02330 [Candidatus Nealsonbacteria bacterium RIFOXYB1_FULL_40_15]|uniref:PEP-utilising enzyme mobile domain-containing protein n=2 Tax=Candidatus Nealsoniibacteriota TaxID=1817911 RepID=A0A1G2EPA1_9BACT|nr:MAG: hypothetical protein A2365_02330 [Candidatus Nealsonbacteria bacterium RIFOXYB1_FULL_40_15]OGZ27625.1 MAG: hypothetical protein A2427_02650 [Candidatus Nealsonbacteria bacterium RIFOXYC1_FULL_40_7]OGZ28429.1 MAG: hypothetical protein A2562_03145 [Candidatus Nealsonbacteria bacterium RIFOXYD1_FULL_39_11]
MTNDFIVGIITKKWKYSYARRMTYQKVRLYHWAFWNGFSKIFNYRQRYEIYRFINGTQSNYFVVQEIKGFEKNLLNKFSDKRFIFKTVRKIPKLLKYGFKKYLVSVKSFPQDLRGYSNAKIIKVLNKYYKLEQEVGVYFWILFETVEKVLVLSTRETLKKSGLSVNEAGELLKKLSEPIKIIPIDMERTSLLKVALLAGEKQEKALKKHCREFGYMPMYDINFESYSLEYFKNKLAELNKIPREDIEKETIEIKEKYKNRYIFYKKTISKFKDKKDCYYLLDFFANFGYLKDFKPYTRDKGGYYIKNTFKEIAKRLELTLDQVLFLNEIEIEGMLKGNTKISSQELDKRKNDSVYYCDEDKIYIITDKEQLNKIDKFLNKNEKTKELEGLGVSAGKCSGKVRIILSNSDFSKFKKGEILVTSATRPDFIPIIQKASAIITDEGGMLSHAAIVSRELKKPCIVGTLKATKVLKDGDVIEVDANNGIIKIIK